MKQLKLTAIFFAVVLSLLSAYLTFVMTKSLGGSLGFPIVLGVIGLCLEGAKQVFSVTTVMCFKSRNRVMGVIFMTLTAALVLISLCATVYTLDKGVSDTRTQSAQHIALTKQIERKEKLYQTQIKHKRFTKAEQTILDIQSLENERVSIQPDDVLSKHGEGLSIAIAALIELTNIALIVVIFLCKQPKIVHLSNESEIMPLDSQQKITNKHKELVLSIKSDIVSAKINPSFRGITDNYSGVGRKLISTIFNELHEDDLIEPDGRGWKLKTKS